MCDMWCLTKPYKAYTDFTSGSKPVARGPNVTRHLSLVLPFDHLWNTQKYIGKPQKVVFMLAFQNIILNFLWTPMKLRWEPLYYILTMYTELNIYNDEIALRNTLIFWQNISNFPAVHTAFNYAQLVLNALFLFHTYTHTQLARLAELSNQSYKHWEPHWIPVQEILNYDLHWNAIKRV